MIPLQKINSFSEITPEDCQSKLLWLLQCDGTRYFFTQPKGDFNKDIWKKFEGAVYRIFPCVFTLSCSFSDLFHKDAPNGISGNFSISAKILPREIGFADWIFSNKISALTIDHLQTYFEAKGHGLHSLIQETISGRNLSDVINNQEDALEFNRKNGVPRWFCISAISVERLSQEISDAQSRINAYNSWVSDQEVRIQKAQQQLEFDVSWANIEEARKEIARRTELAELNHQNIIENSKREQEIKRLQYELEEKRIAKASELVLAQIEHAIEMLTLESENAKADIAKKYKQIEALDIKINPLPTIIKKWATATIFLLIFVWITTFGLYHFFCFWDSDFDDQYNILSQKREEFRKYHYDNYVESQKAFSDFDYYLNQIQDLKKKTLRTRNEVKKLLQKAKSSCNEVENKVEYDDDNKITYPPNRDDISCLKTNFKKLSSDFEKMKIYYPETAEQLYLSCQSDLNKCEESLNDKSFKEANKEFKEAEEHVKEFGRSRDNWLVSLQKSYDEIIPKSKNIIDQELRIIFKEEKQAIEKALDDVQNPMQGTYWKQLKDLEKKLRIFTFKMNAIRKVQELKSEEEEKRRELSELWNPTEKQRKNLDSNKSNCEGCWEDSIISLKRNDLENIENNIIKRWKDKVTCLSKRLEDEKKLLKEQSEKAECCYDKGEWDEAIRASQKIIKRCKRQEFLSQANEIKEKAEKGQRQEIFLTSLKKYHNILSSNPDIKKFKEFLTQDLSSEQHCNELNKFQSSCTMNLPEAGEIENFIKNSKDDLDISDKQNPHKKISDIIKNDLRGDLRAFWGEFLYLFAIYYETKYYSEKEKDLASQAFEMYLKSANHGNPLAQRRLGYIFFCGLLGQEGQKENDENTKKVFEKVINWLEKQNSKCKLLKELRGY